MVGSVPEFLKTLVMVQIFFFVVITVLAFFIGANRWARMLNHITVWLIGLEAYYWSSVLIDRALNQSRNESSFANRLMVHYLLAVLSYPVWEWYRRRQKSDNQS